MEMTQAEKTIAEVLKSTEVEMKSYTFYLPVDLAQMVTKAAGSSQKSKGFIVQLALEKFFGVAHQARESRISN